MFLHLSVILDGGHAWLGVGVRENTAYQAGGTHPTGILLLW